MLSRRVSIVVVDSVCSAEQPDKADRLAVRMGSPGSLARHTCDNRGQH